MGDASFAAGDPRLPAPGGPINAHTLGGLDASAFAKVGDLPSISITVPFATSRHNVGGTTSVTMTSTATSACFLTAVSFEDLDSGDEWGQCEIISSGGFWMLRARLGATIDSDAWCEARCIVWD